MGNVHCALTFEFNNTTDEIEIQYTSAVFILEILAVPVTVIVKRSRSQNFFKKYALWISLQCTEIDKLCIIVRRYLAITTTAVYSLHNNHTKRFYSWLPSCSDEMMCNISSFEFASRTVVKQIPSDSSLYLTSVLAVAFYQARHNDCSRNHLKICSYSS